MLNYVKNSFVLSACGFVASYINTNVSNLINRIDMVHSFVVPFTLCFFCAKNGWYQLRQNENTRCQKLIGAAKVLGGTAGMAFTAGTAFWLLQMHAEGKRADRQWEQMLWQGRRCTRTPWEEAVCEAQHERFHNAFHQDDVCNSNLVERFGCQSQLLAKANDMCWEEEEGVRHQFASQLILCHSQTGRSIIHSPHPAERVIYRK